MSRCLSDQGIDHLVLERGVVGQRWQSERWNSLRLLTPNWMTRLPSWRYQGDDPSGFMHRTEVTRFLTDYSRSFSAPVRAHTSVRRVRFDGGHYSVETNTGQIRARAIVIATGACDMPRVPEIAHNLSSNIHQITPDLYKSPDQIADAGVLIVGASATGTQLARELHDAGRPVTLAVGSHVRVPRTYRGRDIMEWLDLAGILSEKRPEDMDLHRLLSQPSLQLVGSDNGRDIDLASLAATGVRIVGRLTGISDNSIRLDASLADEIERAEDKRKRMLARIDETITHHRLAVAPDRAAWVRPRAPLSCPSTIDLKRNNIRTVIWATGYRRDYSWLDIPVLTAQGEVQQSGGITPCPGLYTLGLANMRRRNSTYIDGVGADARDISAHVALHLNILSAHAA